MFAWLSRLLHWRQGNAVITEGTQTQFIPWKGVYVIARRHAGRTVLTVLNGKHGEASMAVRRYAEVIGSHTQATDVLTGKRVDLTKDIPLAGREMLILEY